MAFTTAEKQFLVHWRTRDARLLKIIFYFHNAHARVITNFYWYVNFLSFFSRRLFSPIYKPATCETHSSESASTAQLEFFNECLWDRFRVEMSSFEWRGGSPSRLLMTWNGFRSLGGDSRCAFVLESSAIDAPQWNVVRHRKIFKWKIKSFSFIDLLCRAICKLR